MTTKNLDLYAGNIIMTRIRLARNLSGYPFKITDTALAKNIVKLFKNTKMSGITHSAL